ncbi:MAG: hypothetical protein QOJ80_556 [Mycobacterium sp.]|jgi:hypothetical protein|nr:hypothetical protein [Mycobacterium sp.]
MAKTPAGGDAGADVMRERHAAARFFWTWLIIATSMSVTGNVAHAVLHAPAGAIALAAGAALVPLSCCWPPPTQSRCWSAPGPGASPTGAHWR